MGAIHIKSGILFGMFSDLVGTKSGLALNMEELYDLLAGSPAFEEYIDMAPEEFVRIRSEDLEAMGEYFLYKVGYLEKPFNSSPGIMAYHRYKGDPDKLNVYQNVYEDFINFMSEILANKNNQRGTSIDPEPFMKKNALRYGKLGLDIAYELIVGMDIQQDIRSIYMPNRDEWKNVVDLNDLFSSEGLEAQYGTFIDQRYIDYLHRNFESIDKINWRKFEGLTAEYFERQGYVVDIGPGRNDDGIDVRIWPSPSTLDAPPAILIQCKRTKAAVDKIIVKSLYADVLNAGAESGLIVTTSHLTPGARTVNEVRDYPIGEAN